MFFPILIAIVCCARSTDNDDLEDGEIPSDEDDEPVSCVVTNNVPEATKSPPLKCESTKTKEFDVKFNKNKKQQSPQVASKHDRFLKYNDPSEDWAADVEKAIKAAMQEDGGRNQETKAKNKNNRNKIRKRAREEREDERAKDQKVSPIRQDIYWSSQAFFANFCLVINHLSFATLFAETKSERGGKS